MSKLSVKKLSIGLITQGINVASTRFRMEQNLPAFINNGFNAKLIHSRSGAYPPAAFYDRMKWLPFALYDAYSRVKEANKFDFCILQRELIATLPTFEPLINVPYIFDVDDAIFLADRFSAAKKIASNSVLTICGNDFLADFFSRYSPVKVIPTSVDTDYFIPGTLCNDRKIIGWSGSSGGFKYLYKIERELNKVLSINKDAIINIISDQPPNFRILPPERVIYKKWSIFSEVEDLQNFSVGIMPLLGSDWERGKCSFKMLTYMAVGIPVVVSPVGMNVQVMRQARCGYLADNSEEWVEAINYLLLNSAASNSMGSMGRQLVEKYYSSRVIGSQYIDALNSIL